VLPARARAAVGDKALWALTGGRSFAPGGYIDQFGNPITPGAPPGGPSPIAPASGGGIQPALGAFLGGIGGPLGNIINFAQGAGGGSGTGGSTGSGTKLTPGFAGLAQAGNNPDLLNQWGTQTGQWLGNFGAQTLTSFATTLWSGALGFFGLQNSILSPSNPWFQAGSKTAGFFLGQNGPLGGQGQGGGQSGSGSGSTIDLAALQQSGAAHLGADRSGGGGGGGNMSPGQLAAIQYAQTHAVGQPYSYGGIGPNYDCSGIASAIYAAAKGLPEGQRYFTTESDFAALGFVPGYQAGALNVGIRKGGGGPNSHMALTLPNGINVESGGSTNTTKYGGTAKGAQSFPIEWHLALASNAGVGAVPGVYDDGGFLPLGSSVTVNRTGKPEAVLTPDQTRAHIQLAQAAVAQQKAPPSPQGPEAHLMQPPPAPAQVAPQRPAAQQEPSPAPPPPATVAPVAPGPAPIGVGQSSADHLLPAVSTGIQSGFAAAGNVASAVASAFGGGAGGGGGLIQGAFAQMGKIATGVANVGASLLVGSVPGSFGDPNLPAGGATLRPQQMTPHTAPLGHSYVFNGIDSRNVVDEMRLKDAQDQQALLATSRG
jgi:hypothetical protein